MEHIAPLVMLCETHPPSSSRLLKNFIIERILYMTFLHQILSLVSVVQSSGEGEDQVLGMWPALYLTDPSLGSWPGRAISVLQIFPRVLQRVA